MVLQVGDAGGENQVSVLGEGGEAAFESLAVAGYAEEQVPGWCPRPQRCRDPVLCKPLAPFVLLLDRLAKPV